MKESRKEDTSLCILIFLIKYGFGHTRSLELGTLKEKALFKHPHGEGNGTPLQYSCLENPMDRGAWKAAVHGVAEGQTRLSNFTFTFHFLYM